MRVLILQGSPRAGGNTDLLCQAMAQAAESAGASVQTLHLAHMTIGGCMECFTCQRVGDGVGCAVKDDMERVYPAVLACDVLVLATPVFCWGPTAQLKAALDRFYALCKFAQVENGQFKCLIEGKPAALVVSAGGGPHDGAEICVAAFRQMAGYLRLDNRGEFVAAPVGEPPDTARDTALLARACEFARGLVQGCTPGVSGASCP